MPEMKIDCFNCDENFEQLFHEFDFDDNGYIDKSEMIKFIKQALRNKNTRITD